MTKRKISDCINVRINVGDYQHIELVKYAEEEIQFETSDERIQKEDALRNELIDSLIRSMKEIPERLNKGRQEAIIVEEKIKKAIPEWLKTNPVPNIANTGKKLEMKVSSTQKDKQDKIAGLINEELSVAPSCDLKENKQSEPIVEEKTKEQPVAKEETKAENDLFEDNIDNGKTKKEENNPVKNDLFDDDDLFDERK